MKLHLLLLPILLAAAPALPAEGFLVVVSETADGLPLPAPFPSREGLAAAFFDDGLILFDLPGQGPGPGDGLLSTAVAAGADYLLELTVAYTAGSSGPVVNARAVFSLRRASGGQVLLQGSLEGTNKGRESGVDRQALGREIGAQVAEKVRAVLQSAGAPQGP